jgi:hypothetical protein
MFPFPRYLRRPKVGAGPVRRDRGGGWVERGPCADPVWGLNFALMGLHSEHAIRYLGAS